MPVASLVADAVAVPSPDAPTALVAGAAAAPQVSVFVLWYE